MKRELNDQIRDNRYVTSGRFEILRHKLLFWRVTSVILALCFAAQSINIWYSGCVI